MLSDGVIADFAKSLQPRVRAIRESYEYHKLTISSFACTKGCTGAFYDSFMRTPETDVELVKAMEEHAATCDGVPKNWPSID